MSLFKNKKTVPNIYTILDNKLQEAQDQNRNVFYCPLLTKEIVDANNWAYKHNIHMEISHKNGNAIIYKFADF